MRKQTILFICTHNSARSQMAEGLVNHYLHNFKAFSAGTKKTMVNPYAIEAMKLIEIDISSYRSKLVDKFLDTRFDIVVTVCDNAKEICPYFPNTGKLMHVSFEDPSRTHGDKEKILNKFVEIRNEIKKWIDENL